MGILKIGNKDFYLKKLEVEDEDYVDLQKYKSSISEMFSIKPENQSFYLKGQRTLKLRGNQIESEPLQILDASLYSSQTVRFYIKIYPVQHCYPVIIFDPVSKTVLDGLETLIVSYNLFGTFNKNFFFEDGNFIGFLQKPLSQVSEIFINFSASTEPIEIQFDNKTYIYNALLKVTVNELIQKLKLYFNAFFDELSIIDSNGKTVDLNTRLRDIHGLNARRTLVCNVVKTGCNTKGLKKNYCCKSEACPSFQMNQAEFLGYGVFDVKEMYYKTKCDHCGNIAYITLEYISCSYTFEKKLKSSQVEDEFDFIKLLPDKYKYITLICL